MELSHRRAKLTDVPKLAQMNAQLIRDEKHRNNKSIESLQTRMSGWIKTGEFTPILFSKNDSSTLVGYAVFKEKKDEVYLRQLFVDVALRRTGVGTEMVEILRRSYWPAGKRQTVDVLMHNERALNFWRKVGFKDYALTLERL